MLSPCTAHSGSNLVSPSCAVLCLYVVGRLGESVSKLPYASPPIEVKQHAMMLIDDARRTRPNAMLASDVSGGHANACLCCCGWVLNRLMIVSVSIYVAILPLRTSTSCYFCLVSHTLIPFYLPTLPQEPCPCPSLPVAGSDACWRPAAAVAAACCRGIVRQAPPSLPCWPAAWRLRRWYVCRSGEVRVSC